MITSEQITVETDFKGAWICLCGNTSDSTGFYACDEKGFQMEPTLESNWKSHYICGICGRIIDSETFNVIGIRPSFELQETDY
jgi:hypothetical protein